jgi:hypothetical protein
VLLLHRGMEIKSYHDLTLIKEMILNDQHVRSTITAI